MNIEEAIEILENLILRPIDWIVNREKYKGNLKYIGSLEGNEAIQTLLTDYEEKCKELKKEIQDDLDVRNRWGLTLQELEKEKEKNKELQSDIQQKNFEIKCLNSDIKNMYCEEGIIAILEDNFNLNREEAIQILEEN